MALRFGFISSSELEVGESTMFGDGGVHVSVSLSSASRAPPAVSGQPAVPAAPSSGFPAAHIPGPWRPWSRNMSSREAR